MHTYKLYSAAKYNTVQYTAAARLLVYIYTTALVNILSFAAGYHRKREKCCRNGFNLETTRTTDFTDQSTAVYLQDGGWRWR